MNLLDLMVRIGVDDQASGQIEGISSGMLAKGMAIGTAFGNIMSDVAMRAATAIMDVGQQMYDSYAQFEQLQGGAQLMFGEGYDFIMEKSQQAYKSVQMSQNDYLTQVNGFAVGLRESLGGNEQAAAELADKIITAEADIVAATGNTQENVQNAFNGIMKGNYTMLDNLQIGIKPTKEGMQEVIDKVNEWNEAQGKATDYTIDSLADCEAAIVDYVDMVGMSGYAAEEAADTLEGSASAMSAAWNNLLAEMGKGDGDISARIDEFMQASGDYIGNLMELIGTVVEHIPEMLDAFLSGITDMINGFSQNTDAFIEGAGSFIMGIGTAIANNLPNLLVAIGNLAINLVQSLVTHLPDMIAGAVELIGGIATGIIEGAAGILTAIGEALGSAVDAVIGFVGDFVQAGAELIAGLIDGFVSGVANFLAEVGNAITQADYQVQMAAQIASPSKLFRKRGLQMMQGLALGISDNMGLISDAMGGVSSALDVDMSAKWGNGALAGTQAAGQAPGVVIYLTYNEGQGQAELVGLLSDRMQQLGLGRTEVAYA